jgi:hypothetical protein
MALLSIAALPILLYSIYYQWRIIKKWCPLCLGIATIGFLQFGLTFTTGFYDSTFGLELNTLLIFSVTLIAISLIWDTLKAFIKQRIHFKKLELEHYKFKRNFSLFNTLYKKGEPLKYNIEIPGEIILGNVNSPLNLTLVTSPLCFFCKKAHSDVSNLLLTASDKFKISIRFLVKPEDTQSDLYKITSQLLHLYNKKGVKTCESALDEIYTDDFSASSWIGERDIVTNDFYKKILDAQYEWATDNTINFTPALYLNNVLYPQEYEREDLKYFIEEFLELTKKSKSPVVIPQPVAS